MSTVADVLTLLVMIRNWTTRIQKTTDLIQKMRSEGRDELTDEELNELQADDDAARDELVQALERDGEPE